MNYLQNFLDDFLRYKNSQINLPDELTYFIYDYIDTILQQTPLYKIKKIIKEYGWNTTLYLCCRKKVYLNFEDDEREITVYIMAREVLYDYFVEHI